jgi:hypothetical protein
VVEGTGLENRQARKRLEGSNPSPSANADPNHLFFEAFAKTGPRGPNFRSK